MSRLRNFAQDECELFILRSDPYALCHGEDNGSRKFTSLPEWQEFVHAVRSGEAKPKAFNQFPYKAGRPEPEWEVEREYWFEWKSEDKLPHVVVHAHSSETWQNRDRDGVKPIGPVIQVNIRHCLSAKEFVDNPSCKARSQVEKSGKAVWNEGLLDWQLVPDDGSDSQRAIRDVLSAGEGAFKMTHSKAWRSLQVAMGQSHGIVKRKIQSKLSLFF